MYSKQNIQEFDDSFETERRIAQEIMETVHRLELPFKLDQLTEGQGNCFPISIIQQCRRPEILSYLRPRAKQIVRLRNGHSTLRQNVMEFMMKSKTIRVQLFKKNNLMKLMALSTKKAGISIGTEWQLTKPGLTTGLCKLLLGTCN